MTERRGPARSRCRAASERGATTVEYALTTAAVIAALFLAPIDGSGQSAVTMLLDALRQFQQNTTYLLSLP